MTDPVRLKLRRTARFNLQEASRAINGLPARSCARPHIFGNPFGWQTPQLGDHACRAHAVRDHQRWLDTGAIPSSHRSQRAALAERRERVLAAIPDLVGHNLGCWCGLDQACHVDYLLFLARSG